MPFYHEVSLAIPLLSPKTVTLKFSSTHRIQVEKKKELFDRIKKMLYGEYTRLAEQMYPDEKDIINIFMNAYPHDKIAINTDVDEFEVTPEQCNLLITQNGKCAYIVKQQIIKNKDWIKDSYTVV